MKREIRIGALAILVTAFAIWGYKFVKGKNLFKAVTTYNAIFDNVEQLTVASPVLINGYKVGAVSRIVLNPENVKSIIVSFQVEGKMPLPKNTNAVLINDGLVGGKIMSLEFEELCSGDNCAKSGDYFIGVNRGFIESLVGKDNLGNYSSTLKSSAVEILDTLNTRIKNAGEDEPLANTFKNLSITIENLAGLTASLNTIMSQSSKNLSQSFANLNAITKNISDNNEQITGLLTNLNSVTTQLKDANLGQTVNKSNKALDQTSEMISELKSTLDTANETFGQLNKVFVKMDEGEGTLSKLLNDKELYSNLELTSKNLSLLLQDMRLNPKRYLSVSVFGKKGKEYVVPEDDPAFEGEKQ
jgi:phospholipid/cholesterol/gamma-HCH transport system substrate-binding protein